MLYASVSLCLCLCLCVRARVCVAVDYPSYPTVQFGVMILDSLDSFEMSTAGEILFLAGISLNLSWDETTQPPFPPPRTHPTLTPTDQVVINFHDGQPETKWKTRCKEKSHFWLREEAGFFIVWRWELGWGWLGVGVKQPKCNEVQR